MVWRVAALRGLAQAIVHVQLLRLGTDSAHAATTALPLHQGALRRGVRQVYLAEMITGDNFKSVVAIKLLHGKWTTHQEIVQRSRDEARVLGLLHHRNIIRVEDLTSINGQCAIVMEYLDGVDLKSLVNDARERESRIPFKVIFEVGSQIASALDAAYNKQPLQGGEPLRLIHRDIKPSNVMLTVAGDVKVLDFGTAQARFDDREAHTQALAFGSAAYMAPERLLGDPDHPAGDIFAGHHHLRAARARWLRHPHPGRTLQHQAGKAAGRSEMGDIDEERAEQIRMTMRLMLSYDPETRPSSSDVTELLEAWLTSSMTVPSVASAAKSCDRFAKTCDRSKTRATPTRVPRSRKTARASRARQGARRAGDTRRACGR